VAAIRFFLYIRFFLNAPLDLLLDVLIVSRSLALHFTVVVPSLDYFTVFHRPSFHFIVVRRVPHTLCFVVSPLHSELKRMTHS
jgi:hypothetical protein